MTIPTHIRIDIESRLMRSEDPTGRKLIMGIPLGMGRGIRSIVLYRPRDCGIMVFGIKSESKRSQPSPENCWGLLYMDEESTRQAMKDCPMVFELLKKC